MQDERKHFPPTSEPEGVLMGSADVSDEFLFHIIYSAEIKSCKCIILVRIAVLWQTLLKLDSMWFVCVCVAMHGFDHPQHTSLDVSFLLVAKSSMEKLAL